MLRRAVGREHLCRTASRPKSTASRYVIETEFKDLGTFRTTNFSSQTGGGDVMTESSMPVMALMNAPFGKAKLARAHVEVTIEKGARLAQIDEVELDKRAYKPGEKVTVSVRWQHYMGNPQYTRDSYQIRCPTICRTGITT